MIMMMVPSTPPAVMAPSPTPVSLASAPECRKYAYDQADQRVGRTEDLRRGQDVDAPYLHKLPPSGARYFSNMTTWVAYQLGSALPLD